MNEYTLFDISSGGITNCLDHSNQWEYIFLVKQYFYQQFNNTCIRLHSTEPCAYNVQQLNKLYPHQLLLNCQKLKYLLLELSLIYSSHFYTVARVSNSVPWVVFFLNPHIFHCDLTNRIYGVSGFPCIPSRNF